MALFDENTDWASLLNRGIAAGTGFYDLFGKGSQSAAGINQAAATAANPFGSQFGQYQAPLAQTTLTPKTNEFGAARSNLFGGYSNALMQPTANQFGAGRSSLYGQYQDLLSNPQSFTNDPFYQWQLGQGTENLERSLAGRGLLDSGNALTEMMNYGQGLAGQAYGNRLAQLQGGIGTASGLYGQDVSQLGAGADRASNLYGQDWQNLYRLSGVTQGSPSEAGRILAGRYGQRNNALANLTYGLQGGSRSPGGAASNPINQIINKGIQGISDWFGGLGGGPVTYGAGDTPENLARLYGDYGWGEAADMGGGSAVDSLSAADWNTIFGSGSPYGAGDTAAIGGGTELTPAGIFQDGTWLGGGGWDSGGTSSTGGGDSGGLGPLGTLASGAKSLYSWLAPSASAAPAAAGTGAAAAGAAPAAAGTSGTAAAGFGGGGAGEAAAGAGLGATAGMVGAVAWPLIWDSILSMTGRNSSKEDAIAGAQHTQSLINTMGPAAFAAEYMNPALYTERMLANVIPTWGHSGQDSTGPRQTAEDAKAALKNANAINGTYVADIIDQAFGIGAAQRYSDQLSAEVDRVWAEQNLTQRFNDAVRRYGSQYRGSTGQY